MATLDLSQAKTPVRMDDPNLVGFSSVDGVPSPTAWSYLTPAGHRVLVKGTNMTFDNGGRPNSGTVTAIEIDVGNNGTTDVTVTGISVGANSVTLAALHGGPAGFWRLLLDGNDVIHGPQLVDGKPFGTFSIVGDGTAARPGDTSGGRDVIQTGNAEVGVDGDVENVGNPVAGSPTSTFRGGNDEILGLVTDRFQGMSGDASRVYRGSLLDGGNDSIFIQSTSVVASAVGDAYDVVGSAIGGDDYVAAGKDFQGKLVGDVMEAHPGSVVQGGADTINGGDLGETIVGDVYRLRGGQLTGGNDTINGGGGNDIIAGDAYVVSDNPTATGGDDVINAGGGNDEVYGDAGSGATGHIGVGGNDRIYGESGNDRLHGDGGDDTIDGGTQSDTVHGGDGNDWLSGGADDDTLHGGSGADLMAGLTGNDTYFVNNVGDVVHELAGFGIDTLWSTLATTTLAANVESLRYNGVGNFTGIGNELANAIVGSIGTDRLEGGGGNDVLTGGAGPDMLIGGGGIDTASYGNASGGVDARLSGNSVNFGGDARGDVYDSVENLAGSGFDDNLSGDDLANTLAGGGGGDNLFGYGGNDLLKGEAGNDRLLAKDGNDVLRGGAGADVLRGGAGSDVFDFDYVADSAAGARDIIAEDVAPAFEGAGVAGGDVIDLAGIDANAALGGNQTFLFGGTGIGRISVVDSGGNTVIRGNTDHDSAFEFELVIEDGGVLASAYKAGDFIL